MNPIDRAREALGAVRLWMEATNRGEGEDPPFEAIEALCDLAQVAIDDLHGFPPDAANPLAQAMERVKEQSRRESIPADLRHVPDPQEPLDARIDTLRGAMVAAFDVLRKRVDSLHGGHELNKEQIQDLQRRVTLLGTVAEKCERALLDRINAEHGLLQDLQQRVSWLEHPER